MSDPLNDLALRLGKTATALSASIREFEHAVADSDDVEQITLVAQTIGGCYVAFDRVNASAVQRLARLEVERELAKTR